MLPTQNHKLVLWSFSWENLHTYELSPTRFHRVQGDQVGLPSVFEKFKKEKKSPNLYFKKYEGAELSFTFSYFKRVLMVFH